METALEQAYRRVRNAQMLLSNQRALIDALNTRGEDASEQEKLLAVYEVTQKALEEDLQRLMERGGAL